MNPRPPRFTPGHCKMDQLTETYQRVSSYLRASIINDNISIPNADLNNTHPTSDQQSNVPNSSDATNGESSSPTSGSEIHEQLLSNLEQLYVGCQEILEFAHEYDFDPSDPANGFRSFVKIITIYFTKLDTMFRVISECNLNGKMIPPKFAKQLPDYMAVSAPFLVQLSILKLVRAKDFPSRVNDACNYSDIDQVILEAVLGFGEKDIRPFYTDIRNFWIHDFIRRLLKGLHKGILMITCPPNQLMKMLFDPTITIDISTKRAVHCSVTDIRKAITVIESKPIRAIQALKYIGKGGSAWMIHVPRQSEWILKAAEGPLSQVTLQRSPRPRVHPRDQQDSDDDRAVVNVTSLPATMLSKFRPFANAATCINGNTSSSSSSRNTGNSIYNSFISDSNGNNNTDSEQVIECLLIKPSTSSSVKSPTSPSPSSSPTIGTPSSAAPTTATANSSCGSSSSTFSCQSSTTGALTASPSSPPKNSLIFHAHGGGFVAMSPRAHQNYLRYWSNQLGVPVICPNYGKAPERPYPCGLQDLLDVYLFITSGDPKVIDLIGFHPENIILTGDSAGGNLSPALAFVLNDMKKIIASSTSADAPGELSASPTPPIIRMPAAIAVHYPAPSPTLIFDASKTSVTYDPILTTAKMITFFSAYHALDQSSDPNPWYRQDDLLKEIPKKLSIKAKDPYYNLMSYKHFDDLKDLKMYITACEFDALLDGAISFAKAWKGPVVLDIARDLPHGFLVGAGRKELDKEIHLVTLRIAQGLGIEYSAE